MPKWCLWAKARDRLAYPDLAARTGRFLCSELTPHDSDHRHPSAWSARKRSVHHHPLERRAGDRRRGLACCPTSPRIPLPNVLVPRLLLPDDWLTSGAWSALGENLRARKHYAEAEPLLISGYNGMREREAKIPAANKPRLEKAAKRLIRFNEETAQPDKAAEWKQKLGELAKPAPEAKLGVETKEK